MRTSNRKHRRPIREQASRNGYSYYSTGVPCKRGHLGERYVLSGACVECSRERENRRRDLVEITLRVPSSHVAMMRKLAKFLP